MKSRNTEVCFRPFFIRLFHCDRNNIKTATHVIMALQLSNASNDLH